MKQIKSFDDAQKVINDLYNRLELLRTKDWDFKGLKISNAGDGVKDQDYVTLRQIKQTPVDNKLPYLYRTIVFSKDGAVEDAEDSPAMIIGDGIEGQPTQIWVCCEPGSEPSGGDLIINVAWTYYDESGSPTTTNLLTENLHLPSGTSNRVFSSAFANPVPTIGRGAKLNKVIVSANNASYVSIGVVLKFGVNIR